MTPCHLACISLIEEAPQEVLSPLLQEDQANDGRPCFDLVRFWCPSRPQTMPVKSIRRTLGTVGGLRKDLFLTSPSVRGEGANPKIKEEGLS